MKKVLRLVKGKNKDKDKEGSISSRGSMLSLAVGHKPSGFLGNSSSPLSHGRTPLRLFQSTTALDIGSVSSYGLELKDKTVSKIHHAALNGDLEKLKKYLKKLDINLIDSRGRTPLHLAASAGHINILYHLVANGGLINARDNDGSTPLQKAVEGDHIEAVQFLLDRGAATDIPDGNGNTACHIAVRQRNIDSLAVILRKGSNPDTLSHDGLSPLHLAVNMGNTEIVELLLRNGAYVNIFSSKNVTPLMLAAKKSPRSLISVLLEYNADIKLCDNEGKTAYDYTKNQQVLSFIRELDTSEEPVTCFPSKPNLEEAPPVEGAGAVHQGYNDDEVDNHIDHGKERVESDLDERVEEHNEPNNRDDIPEHSSLSSWNDSETETSINFNQNNNLLKAKSMFNLSKFIGSEDDSDKDDLQTVKNPPILKKISSSPMGIKKCQQENSPRLLSEENPDNSLNKRTRHVSESLSENSLHKKLSVCGPPKPPRSYDSVENLASLGQQQIYDIPLEESRLQDSKECRKVSIVDDDEDSLESPVWSEDDNIQSFGLYSNHKVREKTETENGENEEKLGGEVKINIVGEVKINMGGEVETNMGGEVGDERDGIESDKDESSQQVGYGDTLGRVGTLQEREEIWENQQIFSPSTRNENDNDINIEKQNVKKWSAEEEEEKTKKTEKETNEKEHECRDEDESWNEENVVKEEEFIKTEQFRLDSKTEKETIVIKQHSQENYEKEEKVKKTETSFTDENERENKAMEEITEDENRIQTKPIPMPRSNISSPLRFESSSNKPVINPIKDLERPERKKKKLKLRERNSSSSFNKYSRKPVEICNPAYENNLTEISNLILKLEEAFDIQSLDVSHASRTRENTKLRNFLNSHTELLKSLRETHNQTVEELYNENRKLREKMMMVTKEKDNLELEHSLIKGRLGTIDCLKTSLLDELDEQGSCIKDKSQALVQLETEMLILKEENAWFENNYETFNDQLTQLKNEIENLRNKNEILEKENALRCEEKDAKIAACEKQIQVLNADLTAHLTAQTGKSAKTSLEDKTPSEIAEMTSIIEKLENDVTQLNAELKNKTEEHLKDKNLCLTLQKSLSTQEELTKSIESKLERKNAELLEIQDVYTTVQLENENLVRACQTLEKESEEQREELEALKLVVEVNNEEIITLTTKLKEPNINEVSNKELKDVNDALTKNEEELNNLKKTLETANRVLEEKDEKINDLEETIENLNEKIRSLKDIILNLENQSFELSLRQEGENVEIKAKDEKENERSQDVNELRYKLQDVEITRAKLEKFVDELTQKLENRDLEIQNLKDLKNKSLDDLDNAFKARDLEIQNLEELKDKSIKDLTQAIEKKDLEINNLRETKEKAISDLTLAIEKRDLDIQNLNELMDNSINDLTRAIEKKDLEINNLRETKEKSINDLTLAIEKRDLDLQNLKELKDKSLHDLTLAMEKKDLEIENLILDMNSKDLEIRNLVESKDVLVSETKQELLALSVALKHKDEEITLLGSKLESDKNMDMVGLNQFNNTSKNLQFVLKDTQEHLAATETAFLELSKRHELILSENKALREKRSEMEDNLEEVESKEIRRLEAKILNLQQKLETIKEEMNSLESDKDALQETEQRLNQRNRDLENKLVALRAELDRTRSANNANDEDAEKLLQELRDKEKELKRMGQEKQREVEELKSQINQEQFRIEDVNSRLGELLDIFKTTSTQARTQGMKFHTFSSVREEISSYSSVKVEDDIESRIEALTSRIQEYKAKESTFESILSEHTKFKISLEQCELQLVTKEKRILELEDEVKRSEDRLKKVSRFLEEQTTRVNILEENYNNTQKEKASLLQKLNRTEDSENIIEELKNQLRIETDRKQREEKNCENLKDNIFKLEKEVQHLKTVHEKENTRLRVVINDLETELKNENFNLRQNILKNTRLKGELDEERKTRKNLSSDLDLLEHTTREINKNKEKEMREEKRRREEEERKVEELAGKLEEERRRRAELENRLEKERKLLEKEKNVGLKLRDLEFETSTLKKNNSGLENELIKTKEKLSTLDDILHENRDLQEAVLKKDQTIEELQNKLSRVRIDEETRFQKTLDRLRTEYEIMAKATVNTKLRKINNYIGEKNKRQEEFEKEKESLTTGIQSDLEERLANTLTELSSIRNKLKRSEDEFFALRALLEKREKQLRAEQSIRRQVEQQLDQLVNRRISGQMELIHPRNSLESEPYVSNPNSKYRSTSSLLFQ